MIDIDSRFIYLLTYLLAFQSMSIYIVHNVKN